MKLFTDLPTVKLETNADWLAYCEKVEEEYMEDFRSMLVTLLKQDESSDLCIDTAVAPIRIKGRRLGIEDETITAHAEIVTKAITPVAAKLLGHLDPKSPEVQHIKYAMNTHRYFVSYCMAIRKAIQELQEKTYDWRNDNDIADWLNDHPDHEIE